MTVVTRRLVLVVLALPVAYGLVLYVLGASSGLSVLYSAVTLSFMAGVPYAVGYLTVLPLHQPGWVTRIVAPWLIFAVILLICWLARWEGSVCIVIASPWLMAFSSLGGITAGVVKDARRKQQLGTLVAIAPLFVIPIENQVPTREEFRTHTEVVEITAPPHAVWEYVVQVDTIQAAERTRSLYGVVGFPAPIAATLDHPRVGGVRLASFERGVVFTETITEWMNNERLHFAIEPNTAAIPRTALDPHVSVGGAYFDVLNGTYELRPIGDTATRLLLRSEYRVSTHLNRYSGWWADRIMQSVQRDILRILKARAESGRDSTFKVLAPRGGSRGGAQRQPD